MTTTHPATTQGSVRRIPGRRATRLPIVLVLMTLVIRRELSTRRGTKGPTIP